MNAALVLELWPLHPRVPDLNLPFYEFMYRSLLRIT